MKLHCLALPGARPTGEQILLFSYTFSKKSTLVGGPHPFKQFHSLLWRNPISATALGTKRGCLVTYILLTNEYIHLHHLPSPFYLPLRATYRCTITQTFSFYLCLHVLPASHHHTFIYKLI